jgi:hypothetical protein
VSIIKVVGVFTTNPTKLGLHFSDVSTIFYLITKFSKSQILLKLELFARPLKLFSTSQIRPGLHKTP